jgi:hypothetical protein
VSYFPATRSAGRLSLSGCEWGEVVVKGKFIRTLPQHLVNQFLIEFCSEGDSGERLCFAPGEYGRAVSGREGVNFAPDGTYLIKLAAVEALVLIEDKAAGRLFLHIVIISAYKRSVNGILLRELCQKLFLYIFETL